MSGAAYDEIGANYSDFRRADPRIEARIWAALGDARSVVNIGAGTGSYEPRDREVIAVEPSSLMIAKRPDRAAPALQGVAETLPLDDKSVDAAMAIFTIHHWTTSAPAWPRCAASPASGSCWQPSTPRSTPGSGPSPSTSPRRWRWRKR
jgi:hypothetical protein